MRCADGFAATVFPAATTVPPSDASVLLTTAVNEKTSGTEVAAELLGPLSLSRLLLRRLIVRTEACK